MRNGTVVARTQSDNGLSVGEVTAVKCRFGFVVIGKFPAYEFMGEKHTAYEYKMNMGFLTAEEAKKFVATIEASERVRA